MTNEQREKLISLRNEGYGYTAIANAVGLSKGSVKAFCRAHGLAGVRAENNTAVDVDTEFCISCGKPLTQTPGRKKRRFCCDECRVKYWNTHQEQVKKKAVYTFVCPSCGREFTAYGNAGRKYCCHPCYIAARFKGGECRE